MNLGIGANISVDSAPMQNIANLEIEQEDAAISKNFLMYYNTEILSKIQDIDIFLKSSDESVITAYDIAQLLYISEDEVNDIARKKSIYEFNAYNFYHIMLSGSSTICSLFRREIEKNSPSLYTIEDISYIFNIRLQKVEEASYALGLNKFTPGMLPALFSLIPV